jgi:peptidoglycan/xylan/chitin deacetylase (PgdA/CDA1 family)
VTPKAVVIYYHAVKPDQREQFAKQMDQLLSLAYPFQAGSAEVASTTERYRVAVTFDDGFESVVENAVPELTKRNIPFILFVPSGCLGRRPSWVSTTHPSWEERVISEPTLCSLAGNRLSMIGSHSVTHPNMIKLNPSEVSNELVRSKADLEAALGREIDLFSFPYGAYNSIAVNEARRAGYRRVFTIEPACIEPTTDPYSVGRFAVDPEEWQIEFRLKIVGAYRWRRYYGRLRQVPNMAWTQ